MPWAGPSAALGRVRGAVAACRGCPKSRGPALALLVRRERPRRDYLAGCKTLAFSQPGSTAGFCVLTAVLDARFTAEVVDATQHDGVQRQSRFNLISVALHTAVAR